MRDLFLKDVGWKLLSLGLAIAIWLTVEKILTESATPVQGTTPTPIIYDNKAVTIVSGTADMHLYRLVPASVKITLTGPSSVMADLQASQIHASVDLTGFDPDSKGSYPVDVAPPPGVTLVSVVPSKVAVIPPPK
jgi:hypothetical protein